MRVAYHGSQTHVHGEGDLIYYPLHKFYGIKLDSGGLLLRVRRSSFTILDNDLDNQMLAKSLTQELDN